jgi:2',3'-cyclic-nucleotide 2'-phosphodiesterase (5'-nucleotidase family)
MRETISILHTNDIHSHLENWPRIRRFLQNQKRQLVREGHSVLTFDIGDAIDRVHPLTEATMGQANIALMNEIGYDGATVGNNEVLGLNHEAMNHLYDQANFPIVLGNVVDERTKEVPDWAIKYDILTTRQGTKVGVLGFTAPFVLTLPLMGWWPEAVSEALERLLPEVEAQSDVIVVLSHLGLPTDRYLADHFPSLNVIIGAHTHHLLANGERHGDVLLAAAGRYGQYVGRITLEVEDGRIVGQLAETVETDTLPVLSEDAAEINAYEERGKRTLRKRQIALLPEDSLRGETGEQSLIQLGLKALEERTHTDIAMLSTGLFMTDLHAGIINEEQLHELLPHAVHPMRTKLTGHDLWRLVHEVSKNRLFMRAAKIRGMGFRGNDWGEIVWDGLTLESNGDVLVHGQALDEDEVYTIGSLDHYLFIPYFPTLEIAGQNVMSYDTVFREDFGSYLSLAFPLK